MEVQLHLFLRSGVDESGQIYAPAALPPKQQPTTEQMVCKNPRAGLDVDKKRLILLSM